VPRFLWFTVYNDGAVHDVEKRRLCVGINGRWAEERQVGLVMGFI